MWVFGILTQKEDTFYYIEDASLCIKLSFTELDYADPDAYFTENMIIMAHGYHSAGTFFVNRIEHPPMHANKSLWMKVNELDYFGAYTKLNSKMLLEEKSNTVG